MALLRVTMVAEDISDCPTFSKGERITIDYPLVVLEESDKVCISAIDQCHPYLLPLSRGVAFATLGIGAETGTLSCCCAVGSVSFSVTKQHRRLSLTPEIVKHLAKLKLEISRLQAMPVFAPLPEGSLEKIIPLLRPRRVATGTDIIQQGDVGQFLYVITKGEALVLREGGQIREEVLATLSEGECFGEMSLISSEPISATIRAKTPVTLLQISKDDFDLLLQENPSLSVYFTKLLTQRLQQAYTRMMEILDKGIQGNIRTFSIPEIVQTLALNSRTGILIITDKTNKAEIYFDKGYIHQVSYNDLHGEEAFYELLVWEEGQFQFQPAETLSITRQINKDTMQLLMEGLRRLDEERARLSWSESSSEP
jgi:uncharacterized repeat protein (TIGR04076 family)